MRTFKMEFINAMRFWFRAVSALTILLVVAGCTNQQLYENVQYNKRRSCLSLPPLEYDECVKKYEKTYEEYERERNEVLSENKAKR